MKPTTGFLSDNFLLENPFSEYLYHEVASAMPVIDYHNHLSPKDIAENRQFKNITEAWLEGDHYKWRAMRANGVSEEFCTGNGDPKEKFIRWAETVPDTLRNPLYHWTHLELKRYFGYTKLLNGDTAAEVYDLSSRMLQQPEFRVQSLLERMKVKVVCTTDDPADSLEHHRAFAQQRAAFRMFPTFRPDKVYATANTELFKAYIEKLSKSAGVKIASFDDLIGALRIRIEFFHSLGCRVSDHGLENMTFEADAAENAPSFFTTLVKGVSISKADQSRFQCAVLTELCRAYHEKGWVQQFHLGALRNNNTRALRTLGADAGFDSIGDFSHANAMSRFLDNLDNTNQLAKTILYNLNPADNAMFATMAGNFNDGTVPGKIQYGSGWWYLDQKEGMESQMNTLSNMGLLSRFVGMVTDSRSFLSFPRHEYFRRILCNLIGRDMQRGEIPNDLEMVSSMVRAICYDNAQGYFGFPGK